jgi:hypothetical protein
MKTHSITLPPFLVMLLYALLTVQWAWVIGPSIAVPFVFDAWRVGHASKDAERLVEELTRASSTTEARRDETAQIVRSRRERSAPTRPIVC